MALDAEALKGQLNMTDDEADAIDETVLTRLVEAAKAYTERFLGYSLTDAVELPGGPPADLEHAILMLAADWYGNREATITGTIIAPVPFGVAQILAEHRRYTFGATE